MTSSRPSTLVLTRPGPLRLFDTAELLRMPPPQWLVHDILPAGGLVGLYGQPGTGKSFIAIDLAMCVASGRRWHDHAVMTGFVLYVSAEGGTGIGKRAQAWLSSQEVSPYDLNMGWLTQSIPISPTSEDMDVLFGRLNDEIEQRPVLVVVDTLARCFDGGDENLQQDMGLFIAGVDRLRREFGATVVIVHHTPRDVDRERGSTAFRGAAETMILVTRPNKGDPITLSCNKQKDADEFADLEFELRVVPVVIGGIPDTSCIIAGPARLSRDATIIAALTRGPQTFTALRDHLPTTSLKRGLVVLRENGEIIKKNGIYRLSRDRAK